MFSREKKTPLAEWWWTIDRELLIALMLLIVCGIVLSFAASPPVGERLFNNPWHFVVRNLVDRRQLPDVGQSDFHTALDDPRQ